MSSWTEILFRLFAWLRPALWYHGRLTHLLEAFAFGLGRESVIRRLLFDPARRAMWAQALVSGERCLEAVIGLRALEILGCPAPPQPRPGIHPSRLSVHPPDFRTLTLHVRSLARRYEMIERLAHRRAVRMRREREAASLMLAADRRPCMPNHVMMAIQSPLSPATPAGFSARKAGPRIRAPPSGAASETKSTIPSPRGAHLRDRRRMADVQLSSHCPPGAGARSKPNTPAASA